MGSYRKLNLLITVMLIGPCFTTKIAELMPTLTSHMITAFILLQNQKEPHTKMDFLYKMVF